ncbi:EAL domain-containing protein [Alkalimonas collagenimarina]|uniref:EAL domain-containing protein n=1 Tax=Alkalimonas collagenimarina TaxID=400390 RepID=A0ABT9H037_9GAMM|nr:EAL domain-containing protein [Alkalimonas collagenimarina]MDP4536677.1 EAL domain-containing protein [Alkalimonas collagenimarina]
MRRLVMCLTLLLWSASWPIASGETVEPVKLVVGVYHNPPKLRAADDGSPSGMLGDLLVEIARREGWVLQAVSCDWAYCLDFLQAGIIDLLPDVAFTEQRSRDLAFHQTPALYSWSQFYSRSGVPVHELADLAGMRIAVLADSVQYEFLQQQFHQHQVEVELLLTDSIAEGFALVYAGSAQLVAANHYFGQQQAKQYQLQQSQFLFQPTQLFYATLPNQHQQILQRIDAYLVEWQQQPDSPYYQILQRWSGTQVETNRLARSYWTLLAISGVLLLIFGGGALVFRWQVAEKTRHLQASEDRLNTILNSVDAYIYIKDMQLCYRYVNKKVAELFKSQIPDVTGHNDYAYFDHATAKKLQYHDRQILEQGIREVREEENTISDGGVTRTFLSVKLPLRKPNGEIYALCGISTDITEHKQQQEAIHQLAFYDALTQLPNRRLLLDRLQHAFDLFQRQQQQGALLFMDLDHFKDLNDTLGHAVGDELLIEVAQRLQGCVRKCDTLARLGGDEFVLLLQELPGSVERACQRVQVIAEKVLQCLHEPFLLQQHVHQISASIGIAMLSDGDDCDELMKRADMAMYDAKSRGRNRLRFFNQSMQVEVTQRTTLTNRLRQGLERKEFFLHFQPQFDERDQVLGAEVLLRWHHPEHGNYPPAEFIPVAETTGLILPLGRWVLEKSCQQLAEWAHDPEKQHWQLAVNISPRQLHDGHFVDEVQDILQQTGAPASQLMLEITESQLLEDIDEAVSQITRLAAMGISFALDDFGTGYSSLQYLKNLPLQQLKIDASFVRDILDDSSDKAIIKTILALGDSLELDVIAEGVETHEQYRTLYHMGCRQFQGYLLGQPGPVEDLPA